MSADTGAYVPDVAARLTALGEAEAEQGEMLLDGTAWPWWEDRSEEGRAA